ncbi:Metalloprotease [Desarmillaria tabescens]|uniref:Neutral protease 2 n=1 Tax=Armillaria tabescens TaxID=1929756 RepID=A0AA39JVP3_ARMTA|nr:Metalloprotease [Desarmillaria tabescens]KAK0449800.1 Metalloprotease [Desarmillaria tabescens]
MFASLFTLGLALTGASVFATPLKRADGLTVSLSGPTTNVTSLEELKFTASITNTGAQAVKILKYGTILDDGLPTRSFTITKDGTTVPFTGIKITVSLTDLDDSAFTTIGAGETVTVDHDVSSLYDFASAGEGTYTFEPVTTFQMADVAAKVAASTLNKVTVSSTSMDVHVSGDLAARDVAGIDKRATAVCSSSTKKTFITSSYTEAKSLASLSSSYISSNGKNTLYTAYWGATSTSTISSVYNAVASESSSSRTLSCTDTYGACTSGVIAYTVISTTNIYYCDLFFNEVASTSLCTGTTVAARNIRGGTTLHELTHAVADTDDVTYGCSADQALSDANARINADNYNCFATQVYQDTQC